MMRRVVLAMVVVAAGGCGGDTAPTTPPTESAPSCPPAGGNQYSGPTSEDLCVTIARDASGAITSFEIEILATCTVGFGQSEFVLNSDVESVTTTEAPSDPDETFQATVSMTTPVEVDASGTFESGNLTGTITDAEAEGSYELSFTTTLVEEISCTGGPITWSAARS